MRRPFSLAMLSVICLSQASLVRGQDVKDVLGVVPTSALGITIITRLDQISDKVAAVAKKVKAPLPTTPLDLAKTLGITKGVNLKGAGAIVLLPGEDVPVPVLVVPVTDYPDFLKQFGAKGTDVVAVTVAGKEMAAIGKGKFAYLCEFAHRNQMRSMVTGKGVKLTGWAQPLREWVESNDATFLGTPQGIKQAGKVMREGLAQAKDFPLPDENLKFVKGWFDGMESMVKSAEADLTHVGFGIRVDAGSNLILDARGLFAKGSPLARDAAAIKPMPGGALANLPAGPYSMALGGTVPPGVMQSLASMTQQIIKISAAKAGADIPAAKLAEFDKNFASLYKGLNGMNYVFGSIKGKEKEGLFSGVVATVATDSADDYLKNYAKSTAATNLLYKELKVPELPIVSLQKKSIGKHTIYEATSELATANDMEKKILEVMYGASGKLIYSQAALDNRTVIASFSSAKHLADIMQKKGRLKDDPEVVRTLNLLPKNPQWVMLIQPRGIMELGTAIVDAAAPGVAPPIPQFPQTPPVGFGASLSESGLIMQIVIPAQVLEGISRVVQGQDA